MPCRCPIATGWCRGSISRLRNRVLPWAMFSTSCCAALTPRRWRLEMDNQSKELFGQTPWQTVGPFFHYGLPWKGGADLTGMSELGARAELFAPEHYLLRTPSPRDPVDGEAIEIFGQVLDGDGQPVPDALVEIWQANAQGQYYAPGTGQTFIGFGRAATGNDGGYRFRTILPGRVPGA